MIRGDRGQAAVELLAGIPALLLAGLVAMQLLAAAYAFHLADGAAEAGALAVAAGLEAEPAARASLPPWARGRARIGAVDGRVEVTVQPPSPLAGVSRALEVRSSAWAKPAGG